MKDLNLKVKMKRRYKYTTDSNHNMPIAANISNRDFYSSNSNEKYVGDKNVNKNIFNICFLNVKNMITGEGWLYLATVIALIHDLYSKKVVGCSMNDTRNVSLVNDAEYANNS